MKFREITIEQLIPFVQSEEFRSSRVIPITPQRAFSQSLNPAASPDDIVLTIAYDAEDRLIGYIGALPDNPLSDQVSRMAWNSCWWVDPEEGNEAAMQLFLRFLGHWDKNVLFSEMTPHTYQILSHMDFFQTRVRYGYRGYMRLALADILPSRYRFLRKVEWLLKGVDGLFNLIWNVRLRIWLGMNSVSEGLSWEVIEDLDDRARALISNNPGKYLGTRGQDDLEWIIKNPWVLETDEGNIRDRYHFTAVASIFEQQKVLIFSAGKPVAFLILNNRDGHLKIPYIFCDDKHIGAVKQFLVPLMIRQGIKDVTTFNLLLSEKLVNSRIPVLHQKIVPRFTGISKKLLEYSGEDFDMQDGDGDVVFT